MTRIGTKDKIENFNHLTELIKQLIQNLMEIVSLFGVVVAAIGGLLNFEKLKSFVIQHKILSESVINSLSGNSNGILSILLIVLLIVLILTIRKAGKQQIAAGMDVQKFLYKLHNDLIHIVRNEICDLYVDRDKRQQYKDNTQALEELQVHAFDKMKNNLQNFVDNVAEVLSKYNNGDVISVCIKIIESGQDDKDILERTARTLVRSKNTGRERGRSNEKVTVGLNTDFKHLCEGTNIWYHGVNLKKLYDEGKYKTEAEAKDWQSKYNSTMVVPIRYWDAKKEPNLNDILGFICIDSKNIIDHWDNEDALELQYLAIYADSLYSYIKLFRRIFNEDIK